MEPNTIDNRGMGKFFLVMFLMTGLSMGIAFSWNSIPAVKIFVHSVLDPILNPLLGWNLTIGMLILVFLVTLITSVVQKYTTDQEYIRQLKKDQKEIQEKMKDIKSDPSQMMELQKKSLPLGFKIMELNMRATIFTIIPLILLFRWFMDYFSSAELLAFKFFGFFSWFWFYLLSAIIFSMIIRKIMKVE